MDVPHIFFEHNQTSTLGALRPNVDVFGSCFLQAFDYAFFIRLSPTVTLHAVKTSQAMPETWLISCSCERSNPATSEATSPTAAAKAAIRVKFLLKKSLVDAANVRSKKPIAPMIPVDT